LVSDAELITKIGYYHAAPYGISKAAVNLAVTKYAIEFRDKELIFVAMSPGFVDTSYEGE